MEVTEEQVKAVLENLSEYHFPTLSRMYQMNEQGLINTIVRQANRMKVEPDEIGSMLAIMESEMNTNS